MDRQKESVAQSTPLPSRLAAMADCFVWRYTKNKSLGKAINTGLALTLAVMVGGWALGPAVFQRHAVADGRVTIYGPVDLDLRQAAREASDLLRQSPFRTEVSVRVVVVPRWYMMLINPLLGRGAQGLSAPGVNLVYINRDAEKEGSARTLGGTLAHETTHFDLYERHGWRAASLSFLPWSWKVEGLCDYVSKQSSVAAENQDAVIARYRRGESLSMREKYLIYKRQVSLVIDIQKMPPDRVLETDFPVPNI